MAKFSYIAKDKAGKTYKDVMDAPNQAAVIERLQKEHYFVVSVREVDVHVSTRPVKKTKTKKKSGGHKKIKVNDLLIFSRQLATMLEAGVSLVRSLEVIQRQMKSQTLADILMDVKSHVERGEALSAALARHPKVFNQFWVSLIEVGEASGTIPVILDKLAFYLEQQASFRSTIISGIIYPAILFCVSLGAIAFFALFVGPRFEDIFTSMGVELPVLTVVLLATFKFIKTYILWLVAGFVALVWAMRKYIRTYRGRMKFEQFMFSLPVFGEIYKLIIIERFASQMAILIDSGVPILYALDITERLVDNHTCALVVNEVKEGVKEGEFLIAPMERSGFFPDMCLQMIMVGEERGELSKMLKHVAKFYQSTVEEFMKRFATVVEPFMLIFMGAVIGTIVLAMFLPMFNISQLGGGFG